jgi:hypothetical protein
VSGKLILRDPVHLQQLRIMYFEDRSEDDWSYEYVANEYDGDWRWGVLRQLVIRDRYDGTLWGTIVKEAIGDDGECSLNEAAEVEFRRVRAVQTTSYEVIR